MKILDKYIFIGLLLSGVCTGRCFAWANLPSDYTEVEFITMPAGSYLDTGLGKANFTYPMIETKFQNLSNEDRDIFGTNAVENGEIVWDLFAAGPTTYLRFGHTTTAQTVSYTYGHDPSNLMFMDAPHTLKVGGSAAQTPIYVDGVLVGTTGTSVPNFSQLAATTTLTINSGRGRNAGYGKWYSFKVTENDNAVLFNGIPAMRKSDSVYGMYDTVTNTFFANRGSGTITGGSPVYNPCRNLFDGEYIHAPRNRQKAQNKNPFYVTPGKKYTASWSTALSISALNVFAYNNSGTLIGSWLGGSNNGSPFNGTQSAWGNGDTMTVPENVSYLIFDTFGAITDEKQAQWAASLQIEEGDTVTPYIAYDSSCFSNRPIKIATTAYNAARFEPLVTDLNNAIANIKNVVANTINQTTAIANLQNDKQQRPDESCPAGKTCLLVEDADGTPHWYEIIEVPQEGED